MKLITRVHDSQRPSKAKILTLEKNFNTAGQGGSADIVLWCEEEQKYYILELENDAEARTMLSAAAMARAHTT